MKLTNSFQKAGMILSALALAFMVFSAGEVSAQSMIDSSRDMPTALGGMTGNETSLRSIVLTIVNYTLGFLGILAVVMIIYGGFLYVSSAGSEDKATQGKTIIMYAVIGIAIILVSFALVNTVLQMALQGAAG